MPDRITDPPGARWLASFKEFPVRQKPASFNLDSVMATMEAANKGAN